MKINPDIKGIKIDQTEYLMNQYADDTTIILDGSASSLEGTLNTLKKFENCSGLKINIDKTNAVWIGSKRQSREKLLHNLQLKWNWEGKFKLLGIQYNLSKENILAENFTIYYNEIKRILNNWTLRKLTIVGKITVIKSLALSKLVHLFMTLPDPDNDYVKKLETMFFKFIWGKGKDRIKRSVIINDIEDGGLNAPHIMSFCRSLKLTWIKKLINDNDFSSWKMLILDRINKIGGNLIFHYDSKLVSKFTGNLNPFWQSVLKSWHSLPKEPATDCNSILRETIWYNSRILVNGKAVFYKQWYDSGIWYINDLVNENGKFLSYKEFLEIYNIKETFLGFQGIKDAIPREWKQILTNQEIHKEDLYFKYFIQLSNLKKPSKHFYNILKGTHSTVPKKSQDKWLLDIPTLEIHNWEDVYSLTKYITKDTKLQVFQYQILHRYLVTNSKLYIYGKKEHDRCTFCDSDKESILHLFW